MNNKELVTLRTKSLEMWKDIAEHGGSKEDYFERHKVQEIPREGCYVCETSILDGRVDCTLCPVTWVKGQESFPAPYGLSLSFCMLPGSSFRDWVDNESKENALAVHNVIQNKWRERNEDQ